MCNLAGLRLIVVIAETGFRLLHFDSRDYPMPRRNVRSAERTQIDSRVGQPLYGSTFDLGDDSGDLSIQSVGSWLIRIPNAKLINCAVSPYAMAA
jgi:hypothetical protein